MLLLLCFTFAFIVALIGNVFIVIIIVVTTVVLILLIIATDEGHSGFGVCGVRFG